MTHPGHTVPHTKPSHWSNSYSSHNLNHAKSFYGGKNWGAHTKNYIGGKNQWFVNKYYSHLNGCYNHFRPYYGNNAFRFYYSSWFNFGFCGGFYYPVRPWYGIHQYFYYPTIYWLYNDIGQNDIPYYQEAYGSEYASCPVQANEYARVYFPTDVMRDLGMEISGLSPAVQCNFRTAMSLATKNLQAQISEMIAASFTFGEYEIVVNHYENLQNQSIVVEGFVDQQDLHVAFKAVLDLINPAQTLVFLPKTQEPTAAELNLLDNMNQKIRLLGGDPNSVAQEPEAFKP